MLSQCCRPRIPKSPPIQPTSGEPDVAVGRELSERVEMMELGGGCGCGCSTHPPPKSLSATPSAASWLQAFGHLHDPARGVDRGLVIL